MTEKTDFGSRDVPVGEKQRLVNAVFTSVAPRYDLMNDLMSFGLHRLWKRFACLLAGVRPGQRVLDVAGGTGDLTAQLASRAGGTGTVVCADVNAAMLGTGRDRLLDRGILGNVCWIQASAEALPFADDLFDAVTIAFGLRNVTDKRKALASMRRVLRPGGRLIVLEFSRVALPWLRRLYEGYSLSVLPGLGRIVTGDRESYQYLVDSIRRHPAQQEIARLMREAGLERVDWHNLAGGIVAVHTGCKL